VAVLLLLLALSALLLSPGLPGDLFFDDIPNLYENTAVQVIDLSADELSRLLISNMAGPLGRPLSYLSFGINHYFTGLAVVPLRATNFGAGGRVRVDGGIIGNPSVPSTARPSQSAHGRHDRSATVSTQSPVFSPGVDFTVGYRCWRQLAR
jgi:hypothetical protein